MHTDKHTKRQSVHTHFITNARIFSLKERKINKRKKAKFLFILITLLQYDNDNNTVLQVQANFCVSMIHFILYCFFTHNFAFSFSFICNSIVCILDVFIIRFKIPINVGYFPHFAHHRHNK